MTNKKYAACPDCGALVEVTDVGSSYTSSEPRQTCEAGCGWSAPLPAFYMAAERAKNAVPNPVPKPNLTGETNDE